MVCPRCVKVVREELTRLGLDVRSVTLGEVVVGGSRDDLPIDRIREALDTNGFGFVEDKKAKIIEKIKHAVLKLVRNDHEKNPIQLKDSECIAGEVGLEYHYLTTLFSQVESLTIEQYVILQKIEYVKELLFIVKQRATVQPDVLRGGEAVAACLTLQHVVDMVWSSDAL